MNRDGVTGFMVDNGDPAAPATAQTRLRRAEELYSRDVMLREVQGLYAGLRSRHGRARVSAKGHAAGATAPEGREATG